MHAPLIASFTIAASSLRLEDVADEAARLTYAVGEGDRREALVYRWALPVFLIG